MLACPLLVGIGTENSHHLIFFTHRIDDNKYVIEGAPAFDKGRILDVAIRPWIRGVCLVTILINELLLRIVITGDKSIMSHPAIFAVDICFVDPFFGNHWETRRNHALEQVNIATITDNRRHAWEDRKSK